MPGNITPGVGLTRMVNDCVLPAQLFASGVTETVAVTGEVVAFVAVKAAMLPVPVVARPIDPVLFVQL